MILKIVCISDTHEKHNSIKIPSCDILIHTGDITKFGSRKKIQDFAGWFSNQPAKYKICIPGNHDIGLQKYPEFANELFPKLGIHYLCDSGVRLCDINFYGIPWTPRWGPWAFMADERSIFLKEKIDAIPEDTDILLSHGPPFGYGDINTNKKNIGCKLLLERIKQIKPKLVACGHIHESYGVHYTDFGTVIVNSSQLNFIYKLKNQPLELIWNMS